MNTLIVLDNELEKASELLLKNEVVAFPTETVYGLGVVCDSYEDLQVDTYRSQGAGGQNVNKPESAGRITHIPTGIVVACQVEKSQIQNREIAMNMLRAKLYAAKQAEQDAKISSERRLKIGTGERSEKIRTYNYPQNRVTDHRIGFTVQKLDRVMEGDLDEILNALIDADQQDKLAGEN